MTATTTTTAPSDLLRVADLSAAQLNALLDTQATLHTLTRSDHGAGE
jgi:hypothetical protein